MLTGGCHCGDIRYETADQAIHHTLCHCEDCRKCAGAPAVAWALAPADQVRITGQPVWYASSADGRRGFCGRCGTGLFYTNEVIFPGQIDVQSATLDTPDALPLQAQIQTADRIGWMADLHHLPAFDRYPGPPADA
ncbi:GFA family protein [Brevundimonas sp. VNH65]|uniref:GFA family protein n=1 Tax=Brevundimonas sp. VNH65 TaxID=3400917 RepID=UPI003C0398C9